MGIDESSHYVLNILKQSEYLFDLHTNICNKWHDEMGHDKIQNHLQKPSIEYFINTVEYLKTESAVKITMRFLYSA